MSGHATLQSSVSINDLRRRYEDSQLTDWCYVA